MVYSFINTIFGATNGERFRRFLEFSFFALAVTFITLYVIEQKKCKTEVESTKKRVITAHIAGKQEGKVEGVEAAANALVESGVSAEHVQKVLSGNNAPSSNNGGGGNAPNNNNNTQAMRQPPSMPPRSLAAAAALQKDRAEGLLRNRHAMNTQAIQPFDPLDGIVGGQGSITTGQIQDGGIPSVTDEATEQQVSSTNSVKECTPTDFQELYEGRKTGILMFHGDFCGHCKAMMPAYERAAAQSTVPFYRLEANQGTSAMEMMAKKGKEYEIQGFPSIYVFVVGNVKEYEGDRSEGSLLHFAESNAGSLANGNNATKQQ